MKLKFVAMSIPQLQRIVCRLCLVVILALYNNQVSAAIVPVNIPESIRKDTDIHTMEMVRLLYAYDTTTFDNWASAIVILKQALANSEAKGLSWGICHIHYLIGAEYLNHGKHQECLDHLKSCEKLIEKPENADIKNKLYNTLGVNYASIGKYALALKYYHKALAGVHKKSIKKPANPKEGWSVDSVSVYNNIGLIWGNLGDLNYALHSFKIAEKIIETNNDIKQAGSVYVNIGNCYKDMGNLQLAEEYYDKALAVAIKANKGKISVALARFACLSNLARKKGEYSKALKYLDSAENIQGKPIEPDYVLVTRNAIRGSIYFDMENYNMAKPLLVDVYNMAKKMQRVELLTEVQVILAKLYAEKGEHKKAYDLLLDHTKIKDTLLKREQVNTVKVLTEALMAEKDRDILAQTLEITRQKNKLQQKNFWIGVVVLCSLLVVTVSFFFVRNYRHKQAIQQSLLYQLQQTQEINQLKAQVRGEEQERQRVARELHDNIAAQLWGIKLNVDNIQQLNKHNGNYDGKLAAVFQQLTDAAQDVRKTAHNLMPDLLLEEGLATALASICEKTAKHTRLEIDFQEYGVMPGLDKEIELSIYRMVQELMQNVLKHATDATHMLVQLSCAGAMLNITVEDNGTVFDVEKKTDGTGLQQIRKRVASLKGYFDLQSIPGKGTTAYLEFDLQHLI